MKKVALVVLAILVAFLGFVALQPADYQISRSIVIQAAADRIFPYVNNSKLMNEWSPWSELDPKAKMSFSGPDSGVGSKTSWEAGEKLGTGSATVAESVPNERVRTLLEYTEPFQMTQDAEFVLQPSSGGTQVTWSVRGKNTFFGRMMCVFGNMDKMVGGIFEKGLASLKAKVEKPVTQ